MQSEPNQTIAVWVGSVFAAPKQFCNILFVEEPFNLKVLPNERT